MGLYIIQLTRKFIKFKLTRAHCTEHLNMTREWWFVCLVVNMANCMIWKF